jgi:hypothetical protein
VFTLAVGAAAGGVDWLNWDLRQRQDSTGTVVAGIGTLSLLLAAGVLWVGGTAAPLFGGGTALVLCGIALSRKRVRARLTYRLLLGGAAIGASIAIGVTILWGALFVSNGTTQPLFTTGLVLSPVFVLLPVGFAVGQGNQRLAIKTAALGFVVSMLPVVPVLPAPFGLGILIVPVAVGYTVAVAIAGMPIFLAGISLGGPSATT